MICPRDGSPLEKVQRGKQTIDRCQVCAGIWCDAEELSALAGTPADLPTGVPELDGLPAACPHCKQSLMRRYYNHHGTVVVDFCDQCRGVWLDDGELKQIVLLAHGLA